ncbi:MAG: hypothetical protein WCK02_09970 [Bacteroidota bacterium]
MNKLLFSLIGIFCFSLSLEANDSTSFLSKIYLPCNWGFSNSINNKLSSGFLFKTGVEYRLHKEEGIFFQFNLDNHSSKFNLNFYQTTNVNNGVLRFSDYSLGIGLRLGKKKLKSYGLIQGGTTFIRFPKINNNPAIIYVEEKSKSMLVLKSSLGLEYYIVESLCFVIDFGYAIIPKEMDFWGKQCQFYSVSLGLTTKLF